MSAGWQLPVLFCSDVNLKTLIDITPYDENHLLITCKSFVKRFRLSDRKQVNSWITKSWDHFTCGAVRAAKTNKIFAVVNQTILYHWHVEENEVQHFKKSQFKSGIHSLVPHNDNIFIIYTHGYVELLEKGIKERKIIKPLLLKENEFIIQSCILSTTNKALLLVKNKIGDVLLYRIEISTSTFSCVSIKLSEYQLTGSLFLPSSHMLTTWSDGNLYCLNFIPKMEISKPGNKIGRLHRIQENRKVKILRLSEHHLAFQGMNANEDGGMLVLFDAKFGVSISMKPLKMYRDPPLAWRVPSGVVVGDGGSLVYVPVMLSPSTVGSMLGSRIHSFNERDVMFDVCVGWRGSKEGRDSESLPEIPISAVQTILSNKSQLLSNTILSLKMGSVSEDVVVDEVVSKLIATKNLKLLAEVISSFSFISEKSLVFVLKFLIELPEEEIDLVQSKKTTVKTVRKKSVSKKKPSTKLCDMTNGFHEDSIEPLCVDMDIDRNDKEDTQIEEVPVCLFSKAKCDLINQILRKSISVEETMKEIIALGFSSSMRLVEYLYFLLSSGIAQLFFTQNHHDVPTVENICTWLIILFDANYQQLLITTDVEIYRIHMKIFTYAKSILEFWQSTFNVEVLVKGISTSDLMPTKPLNNPYSIEKITL